ncbi:6-bladed beta-propeller [Balneola sp. MJW-20]|uniref:6-bladed beta-propeller n=1 Tax=Gracilimonas aurantiaca TaxID=3234185 RepID=UPI0034675D84
MRMRYVIAVLILLSACSGKEQNDPDNPGLNVSLERVQSIYEDPDNENSFMSNIRFLDADEAGNVYMYSGQRNVIMKYLADGSFDRIIGGPGEGPGEYSDVTMMHVRGDSLYIFSRDTQRLLVYDLEGVSYNAIQAGSNLSYPVLQPTGYGYAGFHSNSWFTDEDHAIGHVYDHTLRSQHEDMLMISAFYPGMVEQTLNVLAGSGPLNVVMLDDYTALAAPIVYRGQIYELSYDTTSGQWVKSDSMRSFEAGKLYEEVPRSSKQNDMSFIGPGMEEPANYRYLSRSNRLFITDEEDIVNFTYRDEGDRRDFGVEVFDANYNYLGFDTLETDPLYGDDEFIYFDTPDAYKNGKFYRSSYDRDQGISFVEVLELSIE